MLFGKNAKAPRIIPGLGDGTVKQIVETITQAWPVDKIYFFGSRTRDDWHDGSDIDLLVTVPSYKRNLTDTFIQIAYPMEQLPVFDKLEYDLVVRLTPDFEERKTEFGSVDWVVDKKGVLVYGG